LVSYGSKTCALLGLQRIVVKLAEKNIQILKKFPKDFVEIVIEPPAGIKFPDWSPWGGKLVPVDRMGRRRFIPYSGLNSIFSVEEAMEEAIEVFTP